MHQQSTGVATLLLLLVAGSSTSGAATGSLRWNIREAGSGVPLPVKIVVLGVSPTVDPNFGPPTGLAGGNAILSATGSGAVSLEEGSYRVLVARGMEYELLERNVAVPAGGEALIEDSLARVLDTTGWLSGDFHVHGQHSFDSVVTYDVRVAQAACEGVEVPVATEHEYIGDLRPAIAAQGLGAWMTSFPGEEVTFTSYGHFNGYPLTPVPGDPSGRNGAPDVSALPPAAIFGTLRGDPADPVLEVNHPRSGTFGYFEQIHMDPLTGIVTNPDWSSDFEAVEAVTSKSLTNAELRDWWNLLNLGRRVTGVGNTDTHSVFAHELGWPRTFIQVGTDAPAALTAASLRSALRAGRATVAMGIFVELWVEGAPIGSVVHPQGGIAHVRVRVQAPPWIDVREVRLVRNGVPVLSLCAGGDPSAIVRIDETVALPLSQDSWIVAEAFGDAPLAPVVADGSGSFFAQPFGFTNPVWVDVNGDGVFTPPGPHVPPAAPVRRATLDRDQDLVPDLAGAPAAVEGIATVNAGELGTPKLQLHVEDATGAIAVHSLEALSEVVEGDRVRATGILKHDSGLTLLDAAVVELTGPGAGPVSPAPVTVALLSANPEAWEGRLVRVAGARIASGSWPAAGSARVTLSDGTGSIGLFIPAASGIPGTPRASEPFDLVALVGQHDTRAPFDAGRELIARRRQDFVESGAAPAISGPGAEALGSCAARVRWETTTAADGRVEYGTDASYGLEAFDPVPRTAHELLLEGLGNRAEIHYQVRSQGGSGAVQSADHLLAMPEAVPALLVKPPVAQVVAADTVLLAWETTEAIDGTLQYGESEAYSRTITLPLERRGEVLLGMLRPAALYHLRISGWAHCSGAWFDSGDSTFAIVPRDVVLNEIDSSGSGSGEWVEIRNRSPYPRSLAGWMLSDRDGHGYRFPDLVLPPGALLVVDSGSGQDDVDLSDGWGWLHGASRFCTTDVWDDAGDDAILVDAEGATRDFLRWGGGNGDSAPPDHPWGGAGSDPAPGHLSRCDEGLDSDSAVDWRSDLPPTPGAQSVGPAPVGRLDVSRSGGSIVLRWSGGGGIGARVLRGSVRADLTAEVGRVGAGVGSWTDATPPPGLVGYLVRSFDMCAEEDLGPSPARRPPAPQVEAAPSVRFKDKR